MALFSRDPCETLQHHGRQSHYLRLLQALSAEEQAIFKRISDKARHPTAGGEHVLEAMVQAMRHPGIYRIARENLMLRMALSIARRRGKHHWAERLESILEDFHVAVEAFSANCPLEAAEKQRQAALQNGNAPAESHPCTRIPRETGVASVEDLLEDIRKFKTAMGPNVGRLRQLGLAP